MSLHFVSKDRKYKYIKHLGYPLFVAKMDVSYWPLYEDFERVREKSISCRNFNDI